MKGIVLTLALSAFWISGAPPARADWLALDGENTIWRLADTNGAVINQFAYLTPYHQSWTAMTLGSDGNVYVAKASPDVSGNDVQIFAPNGAQAGSIVVGPYNNGDLAYPGNLTFGPDGNFYIIGVGGPGGSSIARYNGTSGAFLGTFVTNTSPNNLAFGPDGNLYVADASLGVARYNGTNGAYMDTFVPLGTNGAPDAANLLFGPDGNLYVCSGNSNAVVRFDGRTGQFIDYFVPPGSGGLSSPNWLAFGPDDNLYVSSSSFSGTILRYDGRTGAFLSSFGSHAQLGLVYLPDTAPPTVAISAPTNSATVSGTITVSANATDDGAVVGVQFQLDGAALGPEVTSEPYTTTWDTTTVTNGAHTLTALARDGAGNQGVSAPVTVTVSNGDPTDTTPPNVTITAPANSTTISGAITVSADATDNVSVASVQFRLDGANLGWKMTNAPYSVTWNTASATNGAHTLTAVARDTSGNQSISSPVTLTVTNSDPGQILFVSDSSGNIVKITPDGAQAVFAAGTNNFYGLAFDRAGNLFAAAYSAGIIYKFSPGGAQSAFNTSSNACQAYSLAFDDAGNLFADCANVIYKFTPDGGRSSFATTSTPYRIPSAAAFDGGGNLFVTAWTWIYTPSFHPEDIISEFAPDGSSRAFTTPGGSGGTYGMALDTAGGLFYSDYFQGNIYQFTPDGAQTGFASGLNHPAGLALDNQGNLYAADQGSGNIYKFSPDGAQSAYATGLNGPTGLAFAPSVTTPNADPNTTPPAVSMTSPANGATVSGTVTVSADATDNVAVAGVQFQLDGANLGAEVTNAPYTVTWDTTTATNGAHTLLAIAWDAADNQSASAPVTVTVSNAPPGDTAPPPRLSILLSANNTALISWPAAAGNHWTLCCQHGFNATNAWIVATNEPALIGSNYVVTDYCASAVTFYRLEQR